MGKSEDRRTPKASELIGRCAISCFSVVLSQFAILIVPRYFPASAILTQLSLSGLAPCSLSLSLDLLISESGVPLCSSPASRPYRFWQMLQAASSCHCIGSGFRFLQHLIYLARLFCYSSTRFLSPSVSQIIYTGNIIYRVLLRAINLRIWKTILMKLTPSNLVRFSSYRTLS